MLDCIEQDTSNCILNQTNIVIQNFDATNLYVYWLKLLVTLILFVGLGGLLVAKADGVSFIEEIHK